MKDENTKHIRKWTGVSKRILKIHFEIGSHSEMVLLVMYGPSINGKNEQKHQKNLIGNLNGRIIIMGDLSGPKSPIITRRVGRKDEASRKVITIHGGTV